MTNQQPRLFQIWLDASDGSIATYDGVQWPDGTADVHHRYRRPDGVQWSPQARAETIHGKLGRVEWTPDASAGLRERAEAAEAQVARIRAFLEVMAGWCSPHGVAADYARRGLDALDGVDPLGLTGPTREQQAEEQEEADRYAAIVNAPLRPETITAINERVKSGDVPVRKVRARVRDMGRERAEMAIPDDELEPLLALAEDIPPGSPDGRHGWAGESERLPDGSCPAWCPCHRFKEQQS